MIRATRHEPNKDRGAGPAVADRVHLDFDARFRRRIVMQTQGGLTFLLDLDRATQLRDGDALVLDDGRRVGVSAAPEPLARIRCGTAEQSMRVAWHLGNRHLPVMVHAGRLFIRQDAVIERMLAGLGAVIDHVEVPFDPEPGAYAVGEHAHDR